MSVNGGCHCNSYQRTTDYIIIRPVLQVSECAFYPDTAIKPGDYGECRHDQFSMFNFTHPRFMDYILIERTIFNAIAERITEYSAMLDKMMDTLGRNPLGNWVDNERAQRLLHRGKRSLQTLRSSGKIGYTIIDGKVMYPMKEIDRYLKQSYTKDG